MSEPMTLEQLADAGVWVCPNVNRESGEPERWCVCDKTGVLSAHYTVKEAYVEATCIAAAVAGKEGE